MVEMLKRPKGIERTEKVSHAKRNPKSELKKIKEDNRLFHRKIYFFSLTK